MHQGVLYPLMRLGCRIDMVAVARWSPAVHYTGHSLGAGVAAMLTLKMHQRAQGVKCWAFCPPGGLLSQNLSHAAEEYCTSIIVNKDVVPRLSLKTVYRLFEGRSPPWVSAQHPATDEVKSINHQS